MLSRVADTVYWLARYMERTDGMLQVLRTNYISSQDEVVDFSWKPVLQTYGELSQKDLRRISGDSSKVFEHLVLDRENGSSIYNNVLQSRENARAIQDHITKEVWQSLNDYYHFIRSADFERQMRTGDPVTSIDMLIKQNLLFTGTVKNTMTRDESYTYLHLGKFLERAIISTDIVRMKLSEVRHSLNHPIEAPALRYLLYCLYGYELFVKTYKGNFSADNVLELIIYNPHFPHSILYSLYQVNKYFERLRSDSFHEAYEQLEFLIGKTMNNVKYSNVQADNREVLNAFLLQTRGDLAEISNSFSRYYFGNT